MRMLLPKRVKWLESKVPDEDWNEYEQWINSLGISFDIDESPKGGDEMFEYAITNHAEVRMSQRGIRNEDAAEV